MTSRSLTIRKQQMQDYAVESINSLDAEIVLILGGDDLKTDYSWFTNINYYNIKTVIYYGQSFL
jgi:6-phosphofructokinase